MYYKDYTNTELDSMRSIYYTKSYYKIKVMLIGCSRAYHTHRLPRGGEAGLGWGLPMLESSPTTHKEAGGYVMYSMYWIYYTSSQKKLGGT